jgi:hypothetical protein
MSNLIEKNNVRTNFLRSMEQDQQQESPNAHAPT